MTVELVAAALALVGLAAVELVAAWRRTGRRLADLLDTLDQRDGDPE